MIEKPDHADPELARPSFQYWAFDLAVLKQMPKAKDRLRQTKQSLANPAQIILAFSHAPTGVQRNWGRYTIDKLNPFRSTWLTGEVHARNTPPQFVNMTMRILVYLFALVSLLLPEAEAQFAYSTTTGVGPLYDIPSPARDAEMRSYAAVYWDCEDGGDCSGLTAFEWTENVDKLVTLSNGKQVKVQSAPFKEAYPTFSYIYRHRLVDASGNPSVSLVSLLESDPVISRIWRHYMLSGQIVTKESVDAEAFANHHALVVDALDDLPELEMRGVVINDIGFLVTDRLHIINWAHYRSVPTVSGLTVFWSGSVNQDPVDPVEKPGDDDCADILDAIQDLIDSNKDVMEKLEEWTDSDADAANDLYKEDEPTKGDDPGEPGFDCDDYASALGNSLKKQIAGNPDLAGKGVTVTQVSVAWKKVDDSPGAGPKDKETVRHAILKITVCGKNFFIDPMIGAGSLEPTDEGGDLTDDINGIIGGTWEMIEGSLSVEFEHLLNERHGTEPGPFSDSTSQVDRFETIINGYNTANGTSLDSSDFLP